ncbi:MAG: A/G-specific adenine glycosylase [Spirochaetales bacterium]|nr:A/G-specific adenine glycosylase [Spirochaetales bacterium]
MIVRKEATQTGRELCPLSEKDIMAFRSMVYGYYHTYGRILPWRNTQNPYHILVSEIMLQQTQVHRCLEKYTRFIERFPDFVSLASAPFQEILSHWQGLGYNRRALALKRIAQEVLHTYKGKLPAQRSCLMTLPSIGKATAASILAFAFNKPGIVIETNIRAAYIYTFFRTKTMVKDSELLPFIECTLDKQNPREWYYALMDYGADIKKRHPSITRQSAHYKKQSPFHGSDRQIRGKILKVLTKRKHVTFKYLFKEIQGNIERIRRILKTLMEEGFIIKKTGYYTLKK